ncbi:LOW QUALITY PROTEIN: hypothetical protein BC936DRAFT_145800 [Jimgerdemannia flammicorona]|uniref:N-formylglutamate amidohydrolase n=1 Tax=Jimgerdemannia flammicorona TaxID=994334 RepID=A0A433D950_9FUNG|nr:LOW QUALITY PROTEIN: hypothetical protein BC936DRAFT_145800 [Jimgerdemannia flammicorona]
MPLLLRLHSIQILITIISVHILNIALIDPRRFLSFMPSISNTSYVTYIKGTIPLLISVPHGGHLHPDSIPDRPAKNGTNTRNDLYTQEIGIDIAQMIAERWEGAVPYVVICRLRRKKVDVNREVSEARKDKEVLKAWEEYHSFLSDANREEVSVRALYRHSRYISRFLALLIYRKIDYPNAIHPPSLTQQYFHTWMSQGHGHPENLLELGYGLTAATLSLSNHDLDADPTIAMNSTISTLSHRHPHLAFSSLLRGPHSLAAHLELPSIPSPNFSSPTKNQTYFRGGYSVRRYGGKGRGIDAVQVEIPRALRWEKEERRKMVEDLVAGIGWMLGKYYGVDWMRGRGDDGWRSEKKVTKMKKGLKANL